MQHFKKTMLAGFLLTLIAAIAAPATAQSVGPLREGQVQYTVTPDGYIWRCVGTAGGGVSCTRQGRITTSNP